MNVTGSFDAVDEEICGIPPFDTQPYRTLTRMDLTTVEESYAIPLADGTELILSNGRLTLAFPGVPAPIDADGQALLTAGVQIEFDAEHVRGASSGTPFSYVFAIILDCLSRGEPLGEFPGDATLTFPDVQLVLAPDFGLGEDNPVFEIAGDLVGTLAPPCPEDLDGSGDVAFGDVLAVLAAWGAAGGPEDLDGSGVVDFGDLLMVLAAWGPCRP